MTSAEILRQIDALDRSTVHPYFGGKYQLCKNIYRLTPLKHEKFVDVFGGSGVVTLNRQKEWWDCEEEVLNDGFPLAVCLFRVLQIKGLFLEFVRRLEPLTYSQETHSEYSKDFASLIPKIKCLREFEDLTREQALRVALMYFVMARQNRSGEVSRRLLPWAGDHKGKRAGGWEASKRLMSTYHKRLQEVTITCDDWRKVINENDAPDTFFYLDPPYSAGQRVSFDNYFCELVPDDHKSLLARLKTIKGKFLLSNYDNRSKPWLKGNEQYNKQLAWCNRVDFDVVASSADPNSEGKKPTKTEVLWFNYSLPKAHYDALDKSPRVFLVM